MSVDTNAVIACSQRLARARTAASGAEQQILWAVRTANSDELPATVRAGLVEYLAAERSIESALDALREVAS